MRVLSLDLGIKTLGVCVSDPTNIIAIPVENYKFEESDYQSAFTRVKELVEEYKITEIILGYPLSTNGDKSEFTYDVEEFNELLVRHFNDVNIKLVDERFSTKRGIELLSVKFKDKEKLKEYKDMAAAYVLLYDYLAAK